MLDLWHYTLFSISPICHPHQMILSSILVSQVVLTKYHKLGRLNNSNLLSRGSGSQKSKIKIWAGLTPSETSEEEALLCSPLASGGFLAIFGVPWLIEVFPQYLPSSSHSVLPPLVPLPKSPLFMRTPGKLDQGLTILQCSFILSNYICNILFPNNVAFCGQ